MALPERPLVSLTTDSRGRLGYQLDESQFCGQSTKLKNCYLSENNTIDNDSPLCTLFLGVVLMCFNKESRTNFFLIIEIIII